MTENKLGYLLTLLKKFSDLGIGSATRTQLHKISFFVNYELKGGIPFNFVLHKYGPYSFDFDEAIQDLIDTGDITVEYDSGGYGAAYSLRAGTSEDVTPAGEEMDKALGKWVDELGRKGVRELELYATALYVLTYKSKASRDQQIKTVKQIKPHFSESAISQAFDWLEKKGLYKRVA